jgi:hypothetical protein
MNATCTSSGSLPAFSRADRCTQPAEDLTSGFSGRAAVHLSGAASILWFSGFGRVPF